MINISQWFDSLYEPKNKKPFPILSYPCVQLINTSVYELTRNASRQALGMKAIADKVSTAAAVGVMDLSVEAEAFGCDITESLNEIPTILNAIITDKSNLLDHKLPKVGEGRTGVYIEASRLAASLITDRPVFSGIIGPFSLVGQLIDVSEALIGCITQPDFIHTVLERATEFLISYALEYKKTGSSGLIMAEPLAGLLSPELETVFSAPYVKQLINVVQDDSFAIIYHNCGPNILHMTDSFTQNGAAAFHFGDAVVLNEMLKKMPKNKIIFGNISPTECFLNGTPQIMKQKTYALLKECSIYPNFVISSGCDIPPYSSWDNIEAFFAAHNEFYKPVVK